MVLRLTETDYKNSKPVSCRKATVRSTEETGPCDNSLLDVIIVTGRNAGKKQLQRSKERLGEMNLDHIYYKMMGSWTSQAYILMRGITTFPLLLPKYHSSRSSANKILR